VQAFGVSATQKAIIQRFIAHALPLQLLLGILGPVQIQLSVVGKIRTELQKERRKVPVNRIQIVVGSPWPTILTFFSRSAIQRRHELPAQGTHQSRRRPRLISM